MDRWERVQRLRQILDEARERHGLSGSTQPASVASPVESTPCPSDGGLSTHDMPYPIRRKALLARIAVKMKHYGMHEEVMAFVHSAGFVSLYALSPDQLDELLCYLRQCIDDMEACCDSRYAPPAR